MKTFALLCAFLPLLALGQPSEFLQFFDPATGFKPAQTSLPSIFLQLAASLEHYSSPVPYITHIQAESSRIAAKYKAKTGKTPANHLPPGMTDDYIAQEIENWNLLSPKLGLDTLAKESGQFIREGLRGTRDTGTIAVDILVDHQKKVGAGMAGRGAKPSFEALKAKLDTELEYSKERVSTQSYTIDRRDAVSYARIFRGTLNAVLAKIDAALPPKDASPFKEVIQSVFLDLGALAQAELELGILESATR